MRRMQKHERIRWALWFGLLACLELAATVLLVSDLVDSTSPSRRLALLGGNAVLAVIVMASGLAALWRLLR